MKTWNFQKIIRIDPLEDYVLDIEFEDGVSGQISLKNELHGEVFKPLKDPVFFAQVKIADYGAPCWPNGLDIAPDALYHDLKGMQE